MDSGLRSSEQLLTWCCLTHGCFFLAEGWCLLLFPWWNGLDGVRIFFFFSLSEDELIIDFDGRFCLKINVAFSHLTKWSMLPLLLLKGKESCRAVGVWHSFDGPCTLALNYSIWDAEMELSWQPQGSGPHLIVCSKIYPPESRCDRCHYPWKLLADFHGTMCPVCTELLRSLLSEVLMVWKCSELRVKLLCVSGSLPGDCET